MNALVDVALRIARSPAAGLDVPSLLAETSTALPGALGIPAAVIVVLDPAGSFGSDTAAGMLGEAQRREAGGPLSTAIRTGRPMITPDLTRVGPPALAAAAAESMLTSSAAVALQVDGRTVGGLQLLGTWDRPVGEWHVVEVRPVVEVLAALLTDVQAQHRLTDEVARSSAALHAAVVIEQATGMLAERYGSDGEEAARLLRSRAQESGGALVDAARSIVARSDGPTAVPSPRTELVQQDGPPVARHRRDIS